MKKFDPDIAIFAALSGELRPKAADSSFTYANDAARSLFGNEIKDAKITDLIGELAGDRKRARALFEELIKNKSIIIEGTLKGRNVQFHSSIAAAKDGNGNHIQAAIMDTTESIRAQEGFEYTAGALARASEAKDEDTGSHILRINHYSARLAGLLGLSESFVETIGILAQLHDVGKVHTKPEVLCKPSRLTGKEFAHMKEHTVSGAKIIGDHPRLALARQIALGHHEKWDGTGYPHGQSGEMIPLAARIVSIVDVFDALVSKRPYKPAFDYDETLRIMTDGDGRTRPESDFDPHIHKVFTSNYEDFTSIHRRTGD